MFKKIIIVLSLALVLASCGTKNNEIKKHISTVKEKKEYNISKLDSEGRKIVKEYFSIKDEKKKAELKEKIEKHMLEIQSKIASIKWKTIEEKNKEIQKITKKIKLYRSLGF